METSRFWIYSFSSIIFHIFDYKLNNQSIMKRFYTLSIALFLFFSTNAQSGLLAGTGYAPNFTVTDINGTSHTIYDYLDSGYVMVLELLSVSCGHCIQHVSGTENSYLTNGPTGSNIARFLGLEVNSTTNNSAVANFVSTYNVSFPIANNVSPVAINYIIPRDIM